jgi:peptidoglycan/xylan/chitin deacetylase (PgdA/CDA1 family)
LFLFKTPKIFELLYPEAVWHGARDKNHVYLTFDDGPVRGVTEFILDLLSELKIKASFFCVGENVDKNPELFQRIIYEGHSVGNHTYNHLNGWQVKEEDYIKNIRLCTDTFHKLGYKRDIHLFRPPYGKIRRKTLRKINGTYKIIMWDVLSYDFSSKVQMNTCLHKSIRYTKNGSIIIFHDSKKTFDKIKLVISQYVNVVRDMNYEFHIIDDIFS